MEGSKYYGNRFFDGLVKTFSKTTKELGKTTRELGARAEQTIEAQKIRSKITGEERIIEKIKVDIGDIVYRRHSQGDGIDSELSALCQEIDQHYLKIREYKDNAANLKGEKICPSCEREVDINVSFCPYCGTPCPTPEPAKNVEMTLYLQMKMKMGVMGRKKHRQKNYSRKNQRQRKQQKQNQHRNSRWKKHQWKRNNGREVSNCRVNYFYRFTR